MASQTLEREWAALNRKLDLIAPRKKQGNVIQFPSRPLQECPCLPNGTVCEELCVVGLRETAGAPPQVTVEAEQDVFYSGSGRLVRLIPG